jgi:alkanesulfonate monooxygenase SsuD/methylene tetrahydromethanopterin reductase-like flavin-dependent oxidoreductase (luciferase family)
MPPRVVRCVRKEDGMQHGLCLANIGSLSDPRTAARFAAVAEAAGWDGLFVWDHLGYVWDGPSGDPWILLAAAASATARIRLGTAVTPVARRRPQVLAQTVATLDALAGGGRVVFGAGLGGAEVEFTAFGEPGDARLRAEQLDEALPLLRRLWAGERVDHRGRHFTVDGVTLQPAPGAVPIWIGGTSRRARRRAARWDGWIPDSADQERMTMSPAELAAALVEVGTARAALEAPFDVAVLGYSEPGSDVASAYAAAGGTWWLESLHDLRGSTDALLARIEAGPPR